MLRVDIEFSGIDDDGQEQTGLSVQMMKHIDDLQFCVDYTLGTYLESSEHSIAIVDDVLIRTPMTDGMDTPDISLLPHLVSKVVIKWP